jgi:hypothetical protein
LLLLHNNRLFFVCETTTTNYLFIFFWRIQTLTPEGRVKSAILRYLKRRGFFVWNNPTGAIQIRPGKFLRFGKVGSSDIIGVLPDGRFLAVEVKAPNGRLTPEQSAFLEDVRSLGGAAIVTRSFRELDAALRREGYADAGPLFEGDKTLPYGGGDINVIAGRH